MTVTDQKLQTLIDKESRKANTHDVLLGVQSADGRVNFQGAAGDATPQSPYFVASVSKMYTVAALMSLADEGRIDLAAPITDYLPGDLLDGIHVYKGMDYSRQLRVSQLIHQTSGLPNYFTGALAEEFKQNRDHAYPVADALAIARKQPPAPRRTAADRTTPTPTTSSSARSSRRSLGNRWRRCFRRASTTGSAWRTRTCTTAIARGRSNRCRSTTRIRGCRCRWRSARSAAPAGSSPP
ncbi:MAG: beta-lactamase family protein [Chloroflexaceae bacterium]|nr:beta-lactamase family protein [Chloroflexaceae bacterium]